ncbi:hypothetical protein J4573_01865 [Actinomadura barringtoniae]|uniref:Transmembrane protein n=1 Tax=Actinomadura barringtoniae TaxID=1427535 RepID=A0A939P5R9_9ACTN|nr:hypothetical protein [Actinomadura barringtoniae]MBO2445826.1 hypothetical protein [Actinomadura barringtoniae]
MNAMYLIYVPVAVLFVAFVVYAGVVMPFKEIGESVRDRRHPRGPDDTGEKPARKPAQKVVPIRSEKSDERERVAA